MAVTKLSVPIIEEKRAETDGKGNEEKGSQTQRW